MPFNIVFGDILKNNYDVIINPTDERLSGDGGLDRQIHLAAGPALDLNCRDLAPILPGRAVKTNSYKLGCMGIIHTVAPWYTGDAEQIEQLRGCYKNSLMLAKELRPRSIGLPLIGTGFRGFPKDLVLNIANEELKAFLIDNEDCCVTLVVHDMSQFEPSRRRMDGLESFRRERQRPLEQTARFRLCECAPMAAPSEGFKLDESFSQMLLRIIDEKGMTDPECYHKANMDRKLFSKIRKDKDYRPKKTTAVALAVALELDIYESGELLEKAGYSLSKSILFDLIIEYCILNRIYDIFEINELLFKHDQPLLG